MPENHSLNPPDRLRWLYVDFNSYFASVEQQLNPHLRGKPVAVIPVEAETTCAIAASYEAKAFGVKTGTPVYAARKMCPGLVCVLGRHEQYAQFHRRIIEEIDRHIPVSAVCSIDEMACRLMNNETSQERATEIAGSIKDGLAKNVGAYVKCSIGIAPSKYLAKVATDLQKPDGLTILMPEDLPHRLENLHLRDLPGIGASMEARLNHAGIFSVSALLKLQPKHLRAVWGNIWGEKMWYYLRGHDLPDTETERKSIGHSHVLAPDMRTQDQAFQVARRLMQKAAARLRRMGYHATEIAFSCRFENGAHEGLSCRCDPVQDSFYLTGALEKLWQQIKAGHSPLARIRKVGVTLAGLLPSDSLQTQGDLFSSLVSSGHERKMEHKSINLSHAIDALNQKFGKDTVLLGMPGRGQSASASSTKIAFTRIPDFEEFSE